MRKRVYLNRKASQVQRFIFHQEFTKVKAENLPAIFKVKIGSSICNTHHMTIDEICSRQIFLWKT